jgi:hypothetical protein
MFADGGPTEEGRRLEEVSGEVGYGPRWLDLDAGHVVAGGRNVTGGGTGTTDDLRTQP